MKKFSQINESTHDSLSFEEKIDKLIESLDIIVDNDPQAASKNIIIKSNVEFVNSIKNLMLETYLKEKLTLLDKLKSTLYSGNNSWVDDEVNYIKENLKK